MMDAGLALQAQNALLAGKSAPPRVSANMDMQHLRRVAVDFEAFFLSQAFQPMFANLTAEELFGAGLAEDMWRSMQVEEYGKAIANNGGIGIADAVIREVLRMQENEEAPTP